MKLYRLDYSCYARKTQMVLDLLGLEYECIDVTYGDREGMAALTGGYVQVPVFVDDRGAVTVDSRAICETVLQGEAAERLVPSPWQGPIWAYNDWCDGQLEDVTFRIAAGPQSRRLKSAWERSLYVFIKERKFGKGCVAEWDRCRDDLLGRAHAMLAPTRQTLQRRRFLFGDQVTLADAALYGQLIMLDVVEPGLAAKLGSEFPPWMRRVEDARPRA